LLRFLIITHSLAVFASLANALPWLYKLLSLAAVGLSLFISLRRYHYQFQPYCIRYNETSAWSIAMMDDDFQPMQILPSSVITSWLIVLHFQLENGKHQQSVILNDALSEQDYRTLVVTLKIASLSQDDATSISKT
jgi:toxin CptA